MAQEARRGCGYRKVNGLYLCGGGLWAPCCKMPIELHVCPTCNSGIKQSRAWQWIDPKPWLANKSCLGTKNQQVACPADNPELMGDRVGLLWIGTQFYPTPDSFRHEATTMGVSRRIKTVPRGFKLGETWVFFAHPRVRTIIDPETKEASYIGGIFQIFKPTAIEKIVTETMAQDEEAMDKLAEAGITAVIVPDSDKDHQGSVYDDSAGQDELFADV